MSFWNSLDGMVIAEMTSGDINRRLRAINEAGVQLCQIQFESELTARFLVSRRSVKLLRRLAVQHGDHLRVGGKRGIYWSLRSLSRRKLLVIGLLLQLAAMVIMPTRILSVRVVGNQRLPDRLILEAAENAGVGFWASRRGVRSEKMKNSLLASVPELQWAGINTYGCLAEITVREREPSPEPAVRNQTGSIVADRDGYILSVTATRGNGICAPGQSVQAGQVLISGYTDCGLAIVSTRAEGEVMALTRRDFEALTPKTRLSRGEQGEITTGYSLLLGKKRINFYKGSGILDATCVKMYSEYVLSLPGGFALPVKLLRTTWVQCAAAEAETDPADAERSLKAFAEHQLREQMIAGSIRSREEALGEDGGVYRLTGRYACREMIGRYREEEIGESYGKTDRTDGER